HELLLGIEERCFGFADHAKRARPLAPGKTPLVSRIFQAGAAASPGPASAAPRCRRELISSFLNARPRCCSTVLAVSKSAWAISLLLNPSAAICATRRSLAVSSSTPLTSLLRGRAPVAASSSFPRAASALAPH